MCIGAEKIQDAELEVMKVLWSLPQPAALSEIRRILSAQCGWADPTIKTLLRRLCTRSVPRCLQCVPLHCHTLSCTSFRTLSECGRLLSLSLSTQGR